MRGAPRVTGAAPGTTRLDPLEKLVDEFRCDLTQISLNDRA